MKLLEIKASKIAKAGFIPYIVSGGVIRMLFAVSSDAKFGGSRPMIAKGFIDPGEDVLAAAIREASEELGLTKSNLKSKTVELGWDGDITGLDQRYRMSIFTGQVKSTTAFDKPHYETKSTHWLTLEEFIKNGRQSHVKIVKACHSKLSSHLG